MIPDQTKHCATKHESPVGGEAEKLFRKGIKRALVSEAATADGFPKQFWVMDEIGNVFEAMYGGSCKGSYHGYPIRRTDPLFKKISKAW